MSMQRRRKLAPALNEDHGGHKAHDGGCRKGPGNSGDELQHNNNDKKQLTKSKVKIPDNLRYDLQTALVGLCDVWFDEIKPYLQKNNVKLHVYDRETASVPATAEGGGEPSSPAPSRAPCSHRHPGSASHPARLTPASCVGYYSTQTVPSPARWRRRARPPPAQRPRRSRPPSAPAPPRLPSAKISRNANAKDSHSLIRVMIEQKPRLKVRSKHSPTLPRTNTFTVLQRSASPGLLAPSKKIIDKILRLEKVYKHVSTQTYFYGEKNTKGQAFSATNKVMVTPRKYCSAASPTRAVSTSRSGHNYRDLRKKCGKAAPLLLGSRACTNAARGDAHTQYSDRKQDNVVSKIPRQSKIKQEKQLSVECLYLSPRDSFPSAMNLIPSKPNLRRHTQPRQPIPWK